MSQLRTASNLQSSTIHITIHDINVTVTNKLIDQMHRLTGDSLPATRITRYFQQTNRIQWTPESIILSKAINLVIGK